jgi:3,4-dihydroxy-2-butanone 4-phosphate synthase
MTEARAKELDLARMVTDNRDRNGTAFTVTCKCDGSDKKQPLSHMATTMAAAAATAAACVLSVWCCDKVSFRLLLAFGGPTSCPSSLLWCHLSFTRHCAGDAAVGTTTGASAPDRALTARVLAARGTGPGNLNRPGHMLPLVAREGGVLTRGGHTEASVDMCYLAGCEPVALICELMHPDGSMMRRDSCAEFARRHNLMIITTAQIERFRRDVQGGVWPPTAVGPPPVAAVDVVRRGEDERFMNMALAEVRSSSVDHTSQTSFLALYYSLRV